MRCFLLRYVLSGLERNKQFLLVYFARAASSPGRSVIIFQIYYKPISSLIRILIFSISNVFFKFHIVVNFVLVVSEKYITILLRCFCSVFFLFILLTIFYTQIWHLSICSYIFTFFDFCWISPFGKKRITFLFYSLLQYMWVCECYVSLSIYDKSVQSLGLTLLLCTQFD